MMTWTEYDRRRVRFDRMLEATSREYNLWMQAMDLSHRIRGRRPVRHTTSLDAQLAFGDALSRRIARRRRAYEEARRRFFFDNPR